MALRRPKQTVKVHEPSRKGTPKRAMLRVTLTQNYGSLNAGETAGFAPEVAARLVASGAARAAGAPVVQKVAPVAYDEGNAQAIEAEIDKVDADDAAAIAAEEHKRKSTRKVEPDEPVKKKRGRPRKNG